MVYIDLNTNSLDTSLYVGLPNFQGIRLRPRITPEPTFENVKYNFVVRLNDNEVFRQNDNTGTQLLERYTYYDGDEIGFLKFYIETTELFVYSAELLQDIVLLLLLV